MTIKLHTALPKEISLNALAGLSEHGLREGTVGDVMVVARLRPKKATQMLAGFDGDDSVELAVIAVEVCAGSLKITASDLLERARGERLGEPTLFHAVLPDHFVDCSVCDGTGEEPGLFSGPDGGPADEAEWVRPCKVCDGKGEVLLPHEVIAEAVAALLQGVEPGEDESLEEVA